MGTKIIIVLYDADCAFCNVCRRFAERRQKMNVQFVFEDIGDRNAETIIIEPETLKLEKFPACLYIARHMRGPWPIIAATLRILPDRLGNWGYDWVSRHRSFLMKFVSK